MAGKKLPKIVRNPLEAVTDLGQDVGKSLVQDLGIAGGEDFLKFLGMDVSASEGKNSPKKEGSSSVDIVNFKASVEKTGQRIEAAIDYHRDILRSSEKASSREMQTINSQIEQIKAELISLANSTKLLQMEFGKVSVEQSSPEHVGTYHANFFEWMLGMLRAARERVETSEAWMSTQKNKAGKKGYWGMFKKHGTSFGMSNERAVATQVG